MPWPSTLPPEFMPMALRIGPLTMITGPTGIVVASTPWMLNSSVHAASSAARITGMYSGFAPAITALTATFSTVHSTRSGGTTATTSSGARVVPVSIRSTRASVGATTGRPSVQPSIEQRLGFVLERGDLDPAAAQHRCSEPDGEHVDHVGIDRQRAAAGPHVGEVRPQSLDGGERFPRRPGPADGAVDLDAVLHPDQGRDGLDVVVVRDREVLVVDRCEALGERRLVLGEDGELDAGFAELMQDRGHEHTRGALGLDDGDDAHRATIGPRPDLNVV